MKASAIKHIISTLLTVIIGAVCLFALLWFIYTFKVFKLPAFIEQIFTTDNSARHEYDDFEKNLLNILEDEINATSDYKSVSLTTEKALSLLSSLKPVESFFWQVKTAVSQNNNTREQLHSIYKSGDKIRIDTADEHGSFTTIKNNGNYVVVNNDTGEKASYDGDTDFNYDDFINIASLEESLNNDNPAINKISIVEVDSQKYLYVEIPRTEFNGVDNYFVSLDNGFVLLANSLINSTEYYSQKTLTFDSDSVISDTAFDITDLKQEELPVHQ